MKQHKGAELVRCKQDLGQELWKRCSILVTQDKKNGDTRFKRYAWQLEKNTKIVLIQFVGDSSIGGPVYHGNCKKDCAKVVS
jgi:hypothetical protein